MANLFRCGGGNNKIVFDKLHFGLSIFNVSSYASSYISKIKIGVKGFSKINIENIVFLATDRTPCSIRGYDAEGNTTVIASNPIANTDYDISQYDSIEFYIAVQSPAQPNVELQNVVIS